MTKINLVLILLFNFQLTQGIVYKADPVSQDGGPEERMELMAGKA